MNAEDNQPYDVLHIGQYYCDLIFTGLSKMPQMGMEIFGTGLQLGPGGAFNTSYALHHLGLKTGWICDFGQDFFSNYVLDTVRQLGMDTSFFRYHTHNLCAVTAAFSSHQDRGFISYLDDFESQDLIPFVAKYKPRCVLLGGLCCGNEFVELSQLAHQLGVLIVMDCQYRDIDLQTPGVIEVLQQVDVFLPNLGEVQRLTGQETVEGALQLLSSITPLTVVKMGGLGTATIVNGEISRLPAIKIDEVIDTTGAGDCFNAGFLYGFLRKESLEKCLKYANICGGISVTGYGVSQVPSRDQLEDLLENYDELVQGNTNLIPRQSPLGPTFSCSRK